MQIDNKVLLENSKDLTVLYVEDDQSVRQATLKLLESYFQKIDFCEDAESGLSAYQNKLSESGLFYDLIITDIHLPMMNGLEMSQQIRKLNPEQAIILVTAFNEIDYLNDALDLGVNGFLTKPIQLENFKRILYRTTLKIMDKKLLQQHYEQIEKLNILYINQKDASGFESAKNILNDLEQNKEYISKTWVTKEIVIERLQLHYIDVEFFRTHYAIKVIEYFLSVIKGENKEGNCPVIFIMLDFFKNKNLPLKDIFMICVMFKNTVSAYVFNKYTFNEVLFDDISRILDKNFEGVIINYLSLKYDMKENKAPLKVEEKNVELPKEKSTIVQENFLYRDYVLENDLYELQDLEEEIDNLAISVTESSQTEIDDFYLLGKRIKKYGEILISYPIFAELGKSIVKLGESFLSNAQLLYSDKEKMYNIASLIEGFVNDLIIWRREVFEHNIEDPHFLNQSFFSNVDTIIMLIEYDESASAQDADLEDLFF